MKLSFTYRLSLALSIILYNDYDFQMNARRHSSDLAVAIVCILVTMEVKLLVMHYTFTSGCCIVNAHHNCSLCLHERLLGIGSQVYEIHFETGF